MQELPRQLQVCAIAVSCQQARCPLAALLSNSGAQPSPIHSVVMQFLSVLDVSVEVQQRMNGLAHGRLVRRSLLDSPGIGDSVDPDAAEDANVRLLFGFLRRSNPVVKQYKTMLERTAPGCGMAMLPPEAVDSIVAQARQQGPLRHVGQMMQQNRQSFGTPLQRAALCGPLATTSCRASLRPTVGFGPCCTRGPLDTLLP